MEGLNPNEMPWVTWTDFEKDFRTQFETFNCQDDAQFKLENTFHDERFPVETFFEDVEVYRRDSGYGDAPMIHFLKNNLSRRLLKDMYATIPTSEPKTYMEWKRIAIEKDHQHRNLEANFNSRRRRETTGTNGSNLMNANGGGGNRGSFGAWNGGGSGGWGGRGGYSGGRGGFSGGFQKAGQGGTSTANAGTGGSGGSTATTTNLGSDNKSAHTPPVLGTFGGAGVPMEIEQTRGGAAQKFNCYNCGAEGHLSRNCPEPRRPRQPPRAFVRSMFNNLSDDDKKGLLTELGFPTNEG